MTNEAKARVEALLVEHTVAAAGVEAALASAGAAFARLKAARSGLVQELTLTSLLEMAKAAWPELEAGLAWERVRNGLAVPGRDSPLWTETRPGFAAAAAEWADLMRARLAKEG